MRNALRALALVATTWGACWAGPLAHAQPAAPATPAAAPAPSIPAGTPKVAVKATAVTRLDKDTASYALSPDQSRFGTVVRKGERYQVLIDGKPDPADYEWIVANSLVFSHDGKRYGYVVQQGGKMYPVVDGTLGEGFHEIVEANVYFGPGDAPRLAFLARTAPTAKPAWFVDGKDPGKTYDEVRALIWSPDGKRYAYAVRSGDKQFFVLDGVPGGQKEFDLVADRSFTFSADGKRYAYAGLRDKKVYIVVDGKESGPYDQASPPVFSPDGSKVAWAVGVAGPAPAAAGAAPATSPAGGAVGNVNPSANQVIVRAHVVVNDEPQKDYDRVIGETIRFSPDSQRLAYLAASKELAKDKLFYVVDGQPTNAFDQVRGGAFIFSPDSKRYAFVVLDQGSNIVVLDGREGRKFDEIAALQFSPDSRRLAYVARRGNRFFAVTNNVEGMAYDRVQPHVAFSKDGSRMAYVAVRGNQWFVVLDDVEGRDYAGIVWPNLAFTADGRYLAYEAIRSGEGRRPFFVVVGDPRSPGAETEVHGGTVQRSRIVPLPAGNGFSALVLKGEDREPSREVVRMELAVTP